MSTFIQPYARFLDEIRLQQHFLPSVILHFDPEARDLRAWFWPITNAGARVTPSDLMDHRAMYDFRAPSCLCASEFTAERQYTECAMYLAQSGVYSGEYVAGCAFDRCGYLVSLERLYTRRGLLLERYPVRDTGHPASPLVRFVRNKHPPGRDVGLRIPKTYERPIRRADATLDHLFKLDSWTEPGLTEANFRALFARCRCGLVMTRRVFKDHICAVPAAPVVVDLTIDDVGDASNQSGPIVIDLTGDSSEDE